MKERRGLAWLLTTAMVIGMMPTVSYAAVGDLLQSSQEGRHRGNLISTMTDWTADRATGSNATESDADERINGEIDLVDDLVAWEELGVEKEFSGDGYIFQGDTGELTISDDNGTTAWRDNPDIDKEALRSVVLQDGVTNIGYKAFYDCTNLVTVDFSDCTGLKKIEGYAFFNCQMLELEELPETITIIDGMAFSNCSELSLSSLPDGLVSIGVQSFSGCEKLALTSLPDGLTEIPSFAFYKCKNLALTSLPEGITVIGNSAFSGCENLALTVLPSNLKDMNQYAFNLCTNLKLTELPDRLETIGEHAFYGCTYLALSSLPDSLIKIDNGAFYDCRNLVLSSFPGKLVFIGENAFGGTTDLDDLTFLGMTAPELGKTALGNSLKRTIFVPYGAVGYDGKNWPVDRVVYGAALSELTISAGALDPEFFPGTNTYTVSVEESVESLSITPTAHDSESITVEEKPVASGDSSGMIALKPGGITYISVVVRNNERDSRTYTIRVTRGTPATVPVSGVTLNHTELTLYTNKAPAAALLHAKVQPDDATDQTVFWSSSVPDVATVDHNGKVTAVSTGSAVITVTTGDGGRTAACTVHVESEENPSHVPVTGVALDQTKLTLYTNRSPGSAALNASVVPANATDRTVIWSSSAPGVAMVDQNGNVTAVSPGTAVITAAAGDGSKTAACTVTVQTASASENTRESSSDDSGPDYFYRVLTDIPTGITVSGRQINENARLTVRPGALHDSGNAGCDLLRRAQSTGRVVSVYDISLSHGFLESVTVSIPVEGWNGQKMTVARCVGGNLVLADVIVDMDRVVITVDSLSPIALLNGVYTLDSIANFTAPEPEPSALPSDRERGQRYQVKKGDTLSGIASKHGSTVAELVAANPVIKNPNVILPGWIIEIP